jgi:MtfA peptidase
MWNLRAWRRRRLLQRVVLPQAQWRDVVASLAVLRGLSAAELEQLQQLVLLFVHEKSLVGVAGLVLDDGMKMRIAAQACLPILALGLDYYRGFKTVLVYPGGFVVRQEYADEAGVVHVHREALSGEAWERGPVILSWDGVVGADEPAGGNLVIHEFSHALDMLSGVANGLPPLHGHMSVARWAADFGAAYGHLNTCLVRGDAVVVDAYAAQSPAEFFAVLSEAFFTDPLPLRDTYPAVYAQLMAFYRQDPALRALL